MNGRGKSATVIDAASGKVVATIPLEGKPESAQADSKAGKVYVNMEDLNSVKVIDTATHKVTATWPAAPCEAATGMAFDPATHRLFLGCDNKLMVMMDSTNGKVVYSVPVGAGVDSTWFDPADQAGVHLGRRRRHGVGRTRGLGRGAEDRADDQDRPRRAHDGARSGDAHDLSRRHRLRTSGARLKGSPEGGRRHVPRPDVSDEMSGVDDAVRSLDCWPPRCSSPRRRAGQPSPPDAPLTLQAVLDQARANSQQFRAGAARRPISPPKTGSRRARRCSPR